MSAVISLQYCDGLYLNVFAVQHMRQTGSVIVSITQSYGKLGTDAAAATSDEFEYNYTISNNGLLSLYDIRIGDSGFSEKGVFITCTDVDSAAVSGTGHGAVTGLASYNSDNMGLAPGRSLTCSARDSVTQSEVRQTASSGVRHIPSCLSSHVRQTQLALRCTRVDVVEATCLLHCIALFLIRSSEVL